jgi:hypothetical protein
MNRRQDRRLSTTIGENRVFTHQIAGGQEEAGTEDLLSVPQAAIYGSERFRTASRPLRSAERLQSRFGTCPYVPAHRYLLRTP